MFVYKITNEKNGKIYIGQHIGLDLTYYFKETLKSALRGNQDKPRLYNAIRKYGADSFKIVPLVIVGTIDETNYYETELIHRFDSTNPAIGYNIAYGGDNHLHSIEVVEKIRKALTGIKRSPEVCAKNGLVHRGKKNPKVGLANARRIYSEQSNELRRKKMTGRIVSLETKNRMSEARKKYWRRQHGLIVQSVGTSISSTDTEQVV